jgi:GT2 family glycosyltransferase
MFLSYTIRTNIQPKTINNQPALPTEQGDLILTDRIMLDLWQHANGQVLDEIIATFQATNVSPIEIRAALACLAEAGLLNRPTPISTETPNDKVNNHSVSVIIVSYNSQTWLETCLPSLLSQSHEPIEIIVVDNASKDGTADWVSKNYPDITLLALDTPRSLANALNTGIEAASNEYYLLLNPDVELEPTAVANLVAKALDNPNCAAVAAKLKLHWAPAFINGLGNYVGPVSWGTDVAIGHLDLGQFDDWRDVPSACFATALISRAAYIDVGPFDEKFPMYYEDSEWCYRARLYGYSILAAPEAVGYHAFGGRPSSDKKVSLPPRKLRQVVYGRLRFSTKIPGPWYMVLFLCLYILEDITNMILAILSGQWGKLKAYTQAWSDYWNNLPEMLEARKVIQTRRQCTDKELFRLQKDIPMPLIWHGSPELTWDIVRHQYLPLIMSGQTRPLPEFESTPAEKPPIQSSRKLGQHVRRAANIWRAEGFSGLMHRIGRTIQWHLMKP